MAHSYSASSNAVLYKAIMEKETSTNLVKLCRQREQYPEGPLHVLTINGDTVLHMAAHTAKADLVIQLLEMLPQNEYCKLVHPNAVGNTILHEAATFDKLVPAAKKLLEMAPAGLLCMHNHYGETAFFSAARYGQIEMFKFLDTKVGDQTIESEAERKPFYQNQKNNTTVLHMAVIMGHFDLALLIAKQCKYLVSERDEHGMTALQYLARHSVTFEARNAGFLKHLVYYCLLEVEKLIYPPAVRGKDAQPVWRVPLWEAIWMEMVKYESAKKLASFLVELDTTSWKETDCEKSKTEAPLFLAIKAGCVDIVEMILKHYPQAVEHVDSNGCTVLHIAVKYRQERVFNLLDQVGIPWRRLIVQRDRDLNTILHMVGKKDSIHGNSIHGTGNKNPILQLQNDLILFENIKEICSSCSVDTSLYRNREGKTANEVFVENEEKLRTEAVEWVKFITESSSWPSVFIAAAAFSAVYTLPGGLDDKTGVPNLLNQPFFLIFIIAAVLCLLSTTISLAFFFSVLASSFSFKDFKLFIPARIVLGIASLLFAVSMLALAFGATIFLIVQKKDQSTRIGFHTIGFLPFTVVSLSFLPNYIFLTRVFMSNIYIAGVTVPAYPLYSGFSFPSFTAYLKRSRKFIPPPSSSPINRVGETTSVV